MLISHGGPAELGAAILRVLHGTTQYVVKDGEIVKEETGYALNLCQVNTPGILPTRYVQHIPTSINVKVIPCMTHDGAKDFLRRAIRYVDEAKFPYECRLTVTQNGYDVCWQEDYPGTVIDAAPMTTSTLKRIGKKEVNGSQLQDYLSCIVHDKTCILPLTKVYPQLCDFGVTAEYKETNHMIFVDRGRLRAKSWCSINISERWTNNTLLSAGCDYPRDALIYPMANICSFCDDELYEGYLLYGAPSWGCFYVKSCDICAGTLTSHGEWKRKKCKAYKLCSDFNDMERQDQHTRELLGLAPDTVLSLSKIDDITFAGPDLLICDQPLPELADVNYRRGQKYTFPNTSLSAVLA